MIDLGDGLQLPEAEVEFRFTHASGPGGQNVNKTSTAVQLRYALHSSAALPEDVRERLTRLAGNRVTREGTLIINAERFRTRERNRRDALERLAALIRQALPRPVKRRRTKPNAAAHARRLENKRRRSLKKQLRRNDNLV